MIKRSLPIITDESQVPVGYVRVAQLTLDKTLQYALYSAADSGCFSAVKLMRTSTHKHGPIYVDRAAAQAVIDQRKAFAAEQAAVAKPDLAAKFGESTGQDNHLQTIVNQQALILSQLRLQTEVLLRLEACWNPAPKVEEKPDMAAVERLCSQPLPAGTPPTSV